MSKTSSLWNLFEKLFDDEDEKKIIKTTIENKEPKDIIKLLLEDETND